MPVLPSSDIPGGGASPTASIYHSPENSYIDIASGYGIGTNEYVIDIETGIGTIDYVVNTTNNIVQTPEKKIGVNNGYGTESDYINFSNNSWTYPGGSTGTGYAPNIRFQKPLSGIGIQKDKIYWNGILNATYTYLNLQKAIPIAQFITLTGLGVENVTTTLTPNSTTNITTGQKFRLSKELSRGKEISSSWVILKTDPAGTFQSAPTISGVDYSLTLGSLTSDKIEIQFLSNYNFEVKLNISGYTFASNPYQNYIGSSSTNTATATYYFSYSTVTPTFDYEIKFPKLNATVITNPSTALIETNPLTTYQGQVINITPQLIIDSSCYWKKIDLTNTLPPELITKSESEWKSELASKCNITFELRKITTNAIVISQLIDITSSFDVTVQQIGDYKMQFITTLK